MTTYLDKIVEYKKQELESRMRVHSLRDVQLKSEDVESPRDFMGALSIPGVRIIAEIKKASPSKGLIRGDFDLVAIAESYQENGAAALSILTDEKFFQGRLDFLGQVRSCVSLPLLRKDFTLHHYHVYEARAAEADAVLLIAAILEDGQLRDYQALITELGMTALLEVHTEEELDRVLTLSPRLVGINNRHLQTFTVDLETSCRLSGRISDPNIRVVSESGISEKTQIEKLQKYGVHAFLIGESLMREKDCGRKLKSLL